MLSLVSLPSYLHFLSVSKRREGQDYSDACLLQPTTTTTTSISKLFSTPSVNNPETPPDIQHPRRQKTRQASCIAHTRENNQPRILPAIRRQNLPGNRDSRQTPKAHDCIAGRVPAPKLLGLAQLAHADGRQADIAAGGEAEEDAEDAEARDADVGVEPDGQDADEAEEDGGDHGVESAESVGDVAGNPPAEEGAGVYDCEELIREGGRNAIGEGVGGNVRKRDKKPPFDKENAACGERKSRVSKYAEIGPCVAAYFWRQPRADQQVGDEKEEKKYKRHNADGPSVPEDGEKVLEHEGKDYASNGAASSSEAGCGGAGGEEEVGDRRDGGSEDEGGSDAA